jgi:hypothetical protein
MKLRIDKKQGDIVLNGIAIKSIPNASDLINSTPNGNIHRKPNGNIHRKLNRVLNNA